ncbi:MAG: hypothetical protein M3Y93_12470 [Pseudomonadota bacterium]|nr:hypothetical protein [Pseudomonadota bacterium]
MKKHRVPTNAILWTTAILASALLGAPAFLCLILLPSLAVISVLTERRGTCMDRSDRS